MRRTPVAWLLTAALLTSASSVSCRGDSSTQSAAPAPSVRPGASAPSASGPVAAQAAKTENVTPLIEKLQAPADSGKLAERLNRLEKMAQQPSAVFDVSAKARELGRGDEAIFAFVRDEVRYEPYEGVLRGPRGTLMALAGNSFDKSLLLAELLKEHGIEVRFVRGRLDTQRAETLITQLFDAVKLKETLAATRKGRIGTTVKDSAESLRAFVDLTVARWLAAAETVGTALRRAKIGVAEEPPVSRKTLVAEATDHLWIEARQGDAWTALDPSFADAKPGKTYASSAEPIQSIPPTAHHRVSIRLRLEERGARAVNIRDVVQHEATAAELNGAAVSLRHAISGTQTDWTATPVLRIDQKEVRGQTIAGTTGLAEGVTALGKGLFQRAQGKAGEQGITAMWLDFEFLYPSGKKEMVRRELFDRIGLVARNEKRESTASLTPLPSSMPSLLAGAFAFSFSSGTLQPGLARQRLALVLPSLRKTIPHAANVAATDQLTDEDKQGLLIATLNHMAASFHLTSQATIRATLSTGLWKNTWFYEASPRLAVVSAVPGDTAQGKANTVEMSLDLRRNDLRAVADGIPGSKIVWANVTRGLLDAALEHVLFVDAAPLNPAASNTLSTIDVVERARQAGIDLGTVTDGKGLADLTIPALAKARLGAGLDERVALIAPTSAIRVGGTERLGWWRVDLRSGETLGITDTGLHQSSFENRVVAGVTTAAVVSALTTLRPLLWDILENLDDDIYTLLFEGSVGASRASQLVGDAVGTGS